MVNRLQNRHSIPGASDVGHLAAGVLLFVIAGLCSGCNTSPSEPELTGTNSGALAENPAVTSAVKSFCGACHAVPSPESFPRDDWYHEVQRGFDFYYKSGRTDLKIPVQSEIVTWYQARAPETLPAADQAVQESSIRFEVLNLSGTANAIAGVSAVSFVGLATQPVASDSAQAPAARFWCSDMISGHIRLMDASGKMHRDLSGPLKNPAVIRVTDLNANGQQDLVIAELGSPLPEDHDLGKVVWLPDYETSLNPHVLLDKVGRVADVRIGDMDGDGDPDVLAAEFGWYRTGGIHLVRNTTSDSGVQAWQAERLDSRAGAIHVPMVDLDEDGRLDFVSLVSQEHEVVDAWLNRGNRFETVRLFSGADPSWGSSGIELKDFDGDGDVDILYTNGDTFDSNLVKPYHAIRLLVNEGGLTFRPETIAAMPGVHRALAADIDLDGDFDIVAAAILPQQSLRGARTEDLQALIWLEQTESGTFTRHVIQSGKPIYASIVVTDVDNDGDQDVVAGSFDESAAEGAGILHVYRNTVR